MTREEQFEALPTAKYLRECFHYDPETGLLKWRERPASHFEGGKRSAQWEARRRNAISAGKEFGSANTHGHIRGALDGARLYAHRIIWKMEYGSDPEIIDHIDGDPANNRLVNLRNGSRKDNQRNTKKFTSNTSGVPGVYFHRQSGGWYSRIRCRDGRERTKYARNKQAVVAWRQLMEQQNGYTGRAHS